MKIHTHTSRAIHKWIGLIIGVQFLLWTLSGTVMALLPMDEVEGGSRRDPPQVRISTVDHWPAVQRQMGSTPVLALSLRPLLDRQVYEVKTPNGVRLFDAANARPITADATLARDVAAAAYPGPAAVKGVTPLNGVTLAVREHKLPIWRVDFADNENSSYYVSGATGELLERRNDSWRVYDFFWMLHIMDYGQRTSFNHPLIWMFGFAAVWLAISGAWLLFRTGWRSDFKRRRLSQPR